MVALLVNVRLADALPVACGVNVTVNPADCPAVSVAGSVIPDSTNSLLLMPADDTVTEALLALKVPVSALCDPTVTLPKFNVVGDTDNCPGVVPVPESAMPSGELDASDTSDRLPFTVPALAGANLTVKVTLWLAVRVVGKVRPLTEYPVPVTLAWEMVTVAPPVLVTVSDLLPGLPTCTLPKARVVGFADKDPGATPVPERPILSGEFAFDVMARFPLTAPAAVGTNTTLKLTL